MNGIEFPSGVVYYAIPMYALTWIVSVLFNGGYDSPIKLKHFITGILSGLLIILIFYGLLPKEWQFSRLFILISAGWGFSYYLISRVFLHFSISKRFSLSPIKNKRFVIVGTKEEYIRISALLKQTGSKIDIIEHISSGEQKEEGAVGTINQLDQVVHIHGINEIIFSAKDNSAGSIIHWMSEIPSSKVDFKIAQPETLFLIGSNSIETAGDLYVLNINAITKQENVRAKRTFDFVFGMLMLIISPVLVWTFKNKKKFIKNLSGIIFGRYSFVGYALNENSSTPFLPRIRKGILNPLDGLPFTDESLVDKMNLIYARDYTVRKDFMILSKSWKMLDR
jgi:hypothetical protein